MISRERLTILAMVGVFVTSGCLGGGNINKDVKNAQQIRRNSLSAIKNVDSYAFNMDVTVDMKLSGEKDISAKISIDGDGKVSVSDKEMMVDRTVDLTAKVSGYSIERKKRIRKYVVSGTVYKKVKNGSGSGQWTKTEGELSEGWKELNVLEIQEKLLSISEVNYSGRDTINGMETYVLSIEPDPQKIKDIITSQLSGSQTSLNADSIKVSDVSVKQWISKDGNYPVKLRIQLLMTADVSSLDSGGSGSRRASIDTSMTVSLADINKPVNIQVPSAAK
ncbi:MAG: DUF6612 family protein [Halobacteria archaeon]|nr:DUF6612 family protein [Halobacteria archaeon]